MKIVAAFLLGVVCGGLGFGTYGFLGWIVGMVGALSIVTVDYVEEQQEVKE